MGSIDAAVILIVPRMSRFDLLLRFPSSIRSSPFSLEFRNDPASISLVRDETIREECVLAPDQLTDLVIYGCGDGNTIPHIATSRR